MAAFLAQRDEIDCALEDGWTVYQIWETLYAEQKITASYNTFCNQINRLLKRKQSIRVASDAPLPSEVSVQKALATPAIRTDPATGNGYASLPSPFSPRECGTLSPGQPSHFVRPQSDGFVFSSTPNDEDIL